MDLSSLEPFTDEEKRIFLAAMFREQNLCKQIDENNKEYGLVELVPVCLEIKRKVMAALWM